MPPQPDPVTLAARLEQGPMRSDVAARLGVRVCRALSDAPPAKGAPRGLDPSAIQLTTSSEDALEVTVRPGPRRSPPYLSPEQATRASPPDARSEVYAISMVLYEALSGELPIPRCETEEALLTILVTHDPVPLLTAAPWVEPELARVIDRGLSREPSARWASPEALAAKLVPFTGGSERLTPRLLAKRPAVNDALSSERSPSRASRWTLWVPAIAGAALLAGAAGWFLRGASATPAAPTAPARTASGRTDPPPPPTDPSGPSKREVARKLLEGKSFFIHLDPRRPGVIVPDYLSKQPHLVLQVGRDMPNPIPDLDISETGILATLSFKGKPFPCLIPWSSVFALAGEDRKGKIWKKDVPPEVAPDLAAKIDLADAGPPR